MKRAIKNMFTIFKQAYKEWLSKDPFRESASIAYYSIFSLPGLLVVIVTLAGYFFGEEAVNNNIAKQITGTFGTDTAEQIQAMIAKASTTKNSMLATLLGIVTIITGAIGVFVQFQKSLNMIWEVKPDTTKSGVWAYVKVRLFSFGLIVAVAFILIASLVISTILSAVGDWLSGHFHDSFVVFLHIVNFVLSLSILAFLFALMFKFFPDAKIKWRDVWVGSLVTAFLFDIAKFGLGLYFGKANPGTGYGAAASIVLILLWVSYSSMIVFYGAEFTRAYTNMYSGSVRPSEIAHIDTSHKQDTK